jgi:hypothetical protein
LIHNKNFLLLLMQNLKKGAICSGTGF